MLVLPVDNFAGTQEGLLDDVDELDVESKLNEGLRGDEPDEREPGEGHGEDCCLPRAGCNVFLGRCCPPTPRDDWELPPGDDSPNMGADVVTARDGLRIWAVFGERSESLRGSSPKLPSPSVSPALRKNEIKH